MPEQTTGSIEIEAGPAEIMEAIRDFESYPDWAGVRSARVEGRDDRGRPTAVAFELSVPVLGDASYTLIYEYGDDDLRISWTTREASGAVKGVEGGYDLEPLDGDTRVTYRLSVELGVPVPGFLKRRGDREVAKRALEGLKRRVEGG